MPCESTIRFLALILAVTAGTATGAGPTLVFHDDFEAASAASPPAGWSMWGAEQFKTPANYTRDTNNPHGGQGCFRIHHPAQTGGYFVSSPDRAIRPKPAMRYTVSFRARAEPPGAAHFSWTAYRSLRPFADAPSPGTLKFDAGRAMGIVLSQDRPDAAPLLERKEDAIANFPIACEGGALSCPLPPHAVVFVTCRRDR